MRKLWGLVEERLDLRVFPLRRRADPASTGR
jgi:hypothetical protein